jgi:hypothetical protein
MGIRQHRVARIRLSIHLLESIIKNDFGGFCNEGMPDDLEVIGVDQPEHGIGSYFYVIVTSMQFPAIREGESIPELPAVEMTATIN